MLEFFKCVLWLEGFVIIQACLAMLIWTIGDRYRK